jgi:hypothetical protein
MSFNKVYWKTARVLMEGTRSYLSRNQLRLQANLTEEQYNCLVDVLTAITSCLALLPTNPPT